MKKLPVDEKVLPEPLRGRHGYQFYRENEVNKRTEEFFRCGMETDKQGYQQVMDSLAEYICSLLPPIASFPIIANPPAGEGVVTIFVADPAPDMFAAYGKVVDELRSRGFRIVTDPNYELPTDPTSAEAAIGGAIDQAKSQFTYSGMTPVPGWARADWSSYSSCRRMSEIFPE